MAERFAERALTLLQKDYDLISGSDKLTINDVAGMAPGKEMTITGKRADGSEYEFQVTHTFNDGQLQWFRAGSALNLMKEQAAKKA